MTLRDQFTDALKTSMKAGDSARTSTLRMITRQAEGYRHRRAAGAAGRRRGGDAACCAAW